MSSYPYSGGNHRPTGSYGGSGSTGVNWETDFGGGGGNGNYNWLTGGYQSIPGSGANDYFEIDPSGYTGQFADQFFGNGRPGTGALSSLGQGFRGQQGQADTFLQNAATAGQAYNPTAGFNAFAGQAGGQLQGLINSLTSDYGDAQFGQASRNAEIGVEQLASQLANIGIGATQSGGFTDRAANVVGQNFAQAQGNLDQARLGLFGQLGGQTLQGFNQGFGQVPQNALGVANVAQQGAATGAGAFGQALGFGAGFATPTYGSEQYGATGGALDFLGGLLPSLVGLGG